MGYGARARILLRQITPNVSTTQSKAQGGPEIWASFFFIVYHRPIIKFEINFRYQKMRSHEPIFTHGPI